MAPLVLYPGLFLCGGTEKGVPVLNCHVSYSSDMVDMTPTLLFPPSHPPPAVLHETVAHPSPVVAHPCQLETWETRRGIQGNPSQWTSDLVPYVAASCFSGIVTSREQV